MSDILPGSSQSNPVRYRGWLIGPGDAEQGHHHAIEYAHADYNDDEAAFDTRCGYAASIENAMRAIDAYEAEENPEAGHAG